MRWACCARWFIFIFTVDILQFAGLAMILYGLLMKLKLSGGIILIIAAAMSVTGSLIPWKNDGLMPNLFYGLFVGAVDIEKLTGTAFPLLHWFIFVAFGRCFGELLKRCTDKKRFCGLLAFFSAIVLTFYLLWSIPERKGMMGSLLALNFFRTPEAMAVIFGALLAFSFCHFISGPFSEKAKYFISTLSGDINAICCIYWLLLG